MMPLIVYINPDHLKKLHNGWVVYGVSRSDEYYHSPFMIYPDEIRMIHYFPDMPEEGVIYEIKRSKIKGNRVDISY